MEGIYKKVKESALCRWGGRLWEITGEKGPARAGEGSPWQEGGSFQRRGGEMAGGYSRPKRRKSAVASPVSMPSMATAVPVTVTVASVASRHSPDTRSSVT